MLTRLLLILSLLAVSACGGSNTDAPPANTVAPSGTTTVPSEVVFETIDHSVSSDVVTKQLHVVRDATAWAALWAQHTSNIFPPPPVPAVDFSTKMVLAVFLGSRENGCYSVAITRVHIETSSTMVEYHGVIPLPNAICPLVITNPSHIVAIPVTSTPVQFVPKW